MVMVVFGVVMIVVIMFAVVVIIFLCMVVVIMVVIIMFRMVMVVMPMVVIVVTVIVVVIFIVIVRRKHDRVTYWERHTLPNTKKGNALSLLAQVALRLFEPWRQSRPHPNKKVGVLKRPRI